MYLLMWVTDVKIIDCVASYGKIPLLVLFLVFLLPWKLPVSVEGSPESEPEPANESISRQHGGGPKCPSHEPSCQSHG